MGEGDDEDGVGHPGDLSRAGSDVPDSAPALGEQSESRLGEAAHQCRIRPSRPVSQALWLAAVRGLLSP